MGHVVCMYLILLCLNPQSLAAQTGTISGEVTDARAGESLPGATVLIKGTTQGASADIDGRYTLRRVAVGEQVIVFSYMGYATQEIEVTLEADERLELNVQLVDDMIMGEDVIITARQRGQSRSLTRQRQSVNIRSVISAEQIDGFADNTVSGALSRVAGMGHGGANIRGVGSGASNITMDGQRMGSTGDNRSTDLNTISADMVQEMDVIKVVTPDMDADALSGVINISTRRPMGGERSINARLGGGFQDRYFRHLGSDKRASLSIGDSPREYFSYGLNFSYQQDPTASETVNTNWAVRTFDEGPVDVISELSNEVRFDTRDRYGTGFQMTFQPTARSTYHVQSLFNYQEREIRRHGIRYLPDVLRYTSQTQTGPVSGNQARMQHNPRLDESVVHQYTVQGGGRHLMNWYDVEYSVGWGHGRFDEDQYRMLFRTPSRFDFIFDLEDRWNVNAEIAPHSEVSNYPQRELMQFQGIDHRVSSHVDNEFTGKIDFESPYSRGKMKLGSSALLTFKNGSGERFDRSYDRTLHIGSFQTVPNAEWNIFNRDHQAYSIPWIIDLQKAKDLYYGHMPHFNTDMQNWAQESETSSYNAQEHTFASYVMGDIKFGRLTLLGGARVEHTINHYNGREGAIGSDGRFRGAIDINSTTHYTNIFPNAQTVFALSRLTNMRAAYSRSIGRPNFSQLNPYILRNYNSETIQQGNPNLRPMLSHNIDMLFEHYFMNVGQVTLGVFYKDMSDFVYSYTETIRGPAEGDVIDEDDHEYAGWRRSGFRNGEEASIYGIEFSWQQNLTFLPGILGNLGTYANYSYSQSFADIGRRDPRPNEDGYIDVPLTDHRPHVVNIGISYLQGGFNSQVSYQWAAPSISSYGTPQWVPPIHLDHRVWFDQYRDAASDLSMTLRYRLTSSFRVWADASNILNQKQINYFYNRDYYPDTASLTGRRISMGIAYSF